MFALVLLGLAALIVSSWAASSLPTQSRQKFSRTLLVIGVAFVLLVLARAGMPWLAAIGAALLAIVRFIWPLAVRLLPWIVTFSLAQRSRRHSAVNPNSGSEREPPSAIPPTRLSRQDALAILGLPENATEEQIRSAYATLIKKVHPDRGGSAYLAARVNLAKDVLLPREAR